MVSTLTPVFSPAAIDPAIQQAVASEVHRGLTTTPRTLTPWLFYDERGSQLFEQITVLPEYYLTRTERDILAANANAILDHFPGEVSIAELGAGTATKTGLLLAAAARRQSSVLYQPIDVSATALEEAREHLERTIPGVIVRPQAANYITEPLIIHRPPQTSILALYIGSSIGNFSRRDARDILANLRAQLEPGDALLLGTDLAPSPTKTVDSLLAAYDDAQGVTAAFNLNVLTRINRDLKADFNLNHFRHKAIWNAAESRIEMHLESTTSQTVRVPSTLHTPACTINFASGESIHTENSYKFSAATIASLLSTAGFTLSKTFHDANGLFAVTLATAT